MNRKKPNKILTVHPAVMKKINSGNCISIMTRCKLNTDDIVEVVSDDGINSIITKVNKVSKKGNAFFLIELDDPAIAFTEQ